MKRAVIDIGTNTIRGVIYEISDIIKKYKDLTYESEILKYTQNNELTAEGIKRLVFSVYNIIEFFKKENVNDVSCIATSAMRDVKNFEYVNSEVMKNCGISIKLLSCEEEAECDFYSLKYALGDKCSGVGIDLGGGSCQIAEFEKGELVYSDSFPVGVKRFFNKFGEYDAAKKSDVINYLKEIIKNVPKIKVKKIYVMGGTAKVLAKLVSIEKGEKVINFSPEAIKNIAKNSEKYFHIAGKRINTLPYGVDIIKTICDYFQAEEIVVLKNGVREGFILWEIME